MVPRTPASIRNSREPGALPALHWGASGSDWWNNSRLCLVGVPRQEAQECQTNKPHAVARPMKLAAFKVILGVDSIEAGLRRHMMPTLLAGGTLGYFWTGFARRR